MICAEILGENRGSTINLCKRQQPNASRGVLPIYGYCILIPKVIYFEPRFSDLGTTKDFVSYTQIFHKHPGKFCNCTTKLSIF